LTETGIQQAIGQLID